MMIFASWPPKSWPLKKHLRGLRAIERKAEREQGREVGAIRDYCTAVRSALTDDRRPPLTASGLKLHERLPQIAASLDRVAARAGRLPGGLGKLRQLLGRGLATLRRSVCGPV